MPSTPATEAELPLPPGLIDAERSPHRSRRQSFGVSPSIRVQVAFNASRVAHLFAALTRLRRIPLAHCDDHDPFEVADRNYPILRSTPRLTMPLVWRVDSAPALGAFAVKTRHPVRPKRSTLRRLFGEASLDSLQ